MLRIVLLLLGVVHTSSLVEICYVDIRRNTGHSS